MNWSDLGQMVSAVFATWYEIKMGIEAVGAVSDDALHVIAGVLFHLLFAVILRRPLSSWRPVIAVLAILIFNEAVDLWVERWPSLAQQLGESAKDVSLTMALPVLLALSLRISPRLARPNRG